MNAKSQLAAKTFIGMIVLLGVGVIGHETLSSHVWRYYHFSILLIIAVLASRMKVKLPGLNGGMSMNLPFILIAQAQMSPAEALTIACLSTLVQCVPKAGSKLNRTQVMFNTCTMAIAVELGCLILHHGEHWRMMSSGTLLLALSASTFFLSNTLPVAAIISLSEGPKMLRVWFSIFHLSFPYYVASAGITSMVVTASRYVDLQISVLLLAVMYGVYRCYERYFKRIELAPAIRTVIPAEKYSLNEA